MIPVAGGFEPLSHTSLTFLIRLALRDACGLTELQARRYHHGLRVAGINYYRSIGVATSVRAQLADHASLHSSMRYLRLNPSDQIRQLDDIVRSDCS